jgi:hypothetical protein
MVIILHKGDPAARPYKNHFPFLLVNPHQYPTAVQPSVAKVN